VYRATETKNNKHVLIDDICRQTQSPTFYELFMLVGDAPNPCRFDSRIHSAINMVAALDRFRLFPVCALIDEVVYGWDMKNRPWDVSLQEHKVIMSQTECSNIKYWVSKPYDSCNNWPIKIDDDCSAILMNRVIRKVRKDARRLILHDLVHESLASRQTRWQKHFEQQQINLGELLILFVPHHTNLSDTQIVAYAYAVPRPGSHMILAFVKGSTVSGSGSERYYTLSVQQGHYWMALFDLEIICS